MSAPLESDDSSVQKGREKGHRCLSRAEFHSEEKPRRTWDLSTISPSDFWKGKTASGGR